MPYRGLHLATLSGPSELKSFDIDHPVTCTREDALVLIETVESLVEDSA